MYIFYMYSIYICFFICIFFGFSFGWCIRIFILFFFFVVIVCFLFCSKYVFFIYIRILSFYFIFIGWILWRRNYGILGFFEMKWIILKYKYLMLLLDLSRRWLFFRCLGVNLFSKLWFKYMFLLLNVLIYLY